MVKPFDLNIKWPKIEIPKTFLQELSSPKLAPSIAAELKDDYKMADTFYDRIQNHIEEFQKNLKKNQRLLLYYYMGSGDPILITDIGYRNPNLIILYGEDSYENECSILAHMSSVQLVLRVAKVDDSSEVKKIGFLNER